MGSRKKFGRDLARFDRTTEGRWVVVSAWGELDLAAVPEMRAALDPDTFPGNRSDLAMDLAGVTFCDSTSVGVLVGAYKKVRERGGQLILLHTPDILLEQLKISGLDHVLVTKEALNAD